VAANTIGFGLMVQPGKHRGFRLVATQAVAGIIGKIMLRTVNVVASHARHFRGLKAAAFLQQFDLAAVYINLRNGIWRRQLKVFGQRFAWPIRKCGSDIRPRTRVAPSAQV